jgi:hypothetical protein
VEKVVIAFKVFGEEEEMSGSLLRRSRFLVKATPRGEVNFAPDDRFDAGIFAFFIKLNRAEEISVVGQRQGRHRELLCLFGKILRTAGPIEQAVFRMNMKMDKRGHNLSRQRSSQNNDLMDID